MSWVEAWGGHGAVHVGNAAEFNAGFGGGFAGRDHYSCLAVFASPLPVGIVLPEKVDDGWIQGLAGQLGWGDIRLFSGVAGHGRMSRGIRQNPEVHEFLLETRVPVLPWGRTAGFERILPTDIGVLELIHRYESKRRANTLFGELAGGHPGITVPAQRKAPRRKDLLRTLRSETPLVLKTEYGVGGTGTLLVKPDTERLRRTARQWAHDGVLVEEYMEKVHDPTFDGLVDRDGRVHPVGTGAMEIDGTKYQGVTVGPGALPRATEDTATAFGTAVGERLAEHGYRGWYDVDFVATKTGHLAPTEINLRLTGPTAAFTIQTRLNTLRGGTHLVRTIDRLPLGARLPPAALNEHMEHINEECREATVLTTIPTAAFDPVPYVGVAIAAKTHQTLDKAEETVRKENERLEEMFSRPPARVWWPRREPGHRPRASE